MLLSNKHFAFLFFCLITFSSFTSAKTIFVSSTTGDDGNKGDETAPLLTISKALKQADTILLKAGDCFYGNYFLNKKYLGRYGNGANPTIKGYKRIMIPNWVKVSDNIWRINLIENNFSGCVIDGSSLLNNIGCIHEYDKDVIHGRKVQYVAQLKNNWDIWQTEHYSIDMDPSSLDYLYMYYEGNPNLLKLEFAIGECAISMRYSTIECVNFEGFGFGISVVLSDNIIRGCKIDAIGGMALLSAKDFVLHGNGISLYFGQYNVANCIVEGNYISRCYDCGLCLQGTATNDSNGINVVFRDNLVTKCCQGLENFSESTSTLFDNCVAQNNYFINNGESGFGYPDTRFKHCQILENNTKGPKGFVYINNIFIDGNFYCAATYEKRNYTSSVFENNICYLSPNQFIISDYYGKEDVVYVVKDSFFKCDNIQRINNYRDLTNDFSTKFNIASENRLRRLSQKKISEYMSVHKF